ILAMAGPGIRHDELVFGAGLLDIAPTVLTLLGLPAGEDMQGRVLAEAFDRPPSPERIGSWDEVSGDSGMHRAGEEHDKWHAAAVVEQLLALGYVEPGGEDPSRQLEAARQHQTFTLARVHLSGGRSDEAIPLLEELVRQRPDDRHYRLFLAQTYQEARRI